MYQDIADEVRKRVSVNNDVEAAAAYRRGHPGCRTGVPRRVSSASAPTTPSPPDDPGSTEKPAAPATKRERACRPFASVTLDERGPRMSATLKASSTSSAIFRLGPMKETSHWF
jgi:hypothetical protein